MLLTACGNAENATFLSNYAGKVVASKHILQEDIGGSVPDPWIPWIVDVRKVSPALCCFELDGDGITWGAKGGDLYRGIPGGDDFEFVRHFAATVHGIHWTRDDVLYVATDADRWDQDRCAGA